jgi:hypothetical protein
MELYRRFSVRNFEMKTELTAITYLVQQLLRYALMLVGEDEEGK